MYSVNNTIEECAADIAYSLGVGEDKQLVIQSYLHQYFNQIITEHSLQIEQRAFFDSEEE
jgi:hypothetical protein